MSGKYLTVPEFAAKAGVSKQAIYDQVQPGRRLAPYCKKVNKKRMIRADALSFYTKKDDDDNQEPEPEVADPIVSLLMDQITVKDKQLEAQAADLAAKNEQIKDLTETIRANMTMIYTLQNQVARLTGEVAPDQEPAARPEPAAVHEQAKAPEPEKAATSAACCWQS